LPIDQTPVYAALLMFIPAIMIPLLAKSFLKEEGLLAKGPNYSIAIMAGVSFIVPFIGFAFSLGPDFPSIAAPVAGLTVWLLLLKTKGSSLAIINRTTLVNFYSTFKPYLFIAFLLITGKFLFADLKFIIDYPAIQLKKSISTFQPGIIFVVGLLILWWKNKNKAEISLKSIFKQTIFPLPVTLVTIACLAILAKLVSQDLNLGNLLSSRNIPAPLFYIMALTTGFLGSFIAGSATVSNLMFGTEWYAAGQQLQLNTPLLLAAQLAGAGLGNALSVQNIAMVQAVLNEKELGPVIINKLWRPVLLLLFLTMSTAVVLCYIDYSFT
jgi:lactate permease